MAGNEIMNLLLVSPLLAMVLLIFVLMGVDLFFRKQYFHISLWIAAAGMALISIGTLVFGSQLSSEQLIWGGLLRMDMVGVVMITLISAGASVTLVLAGSQPGIADRGEFPILLIASSLGLSLMTISFDLIALYIALEMAGIPLYVLAGFLIREKGSTEAGLKYFLYGAMSSAIMLYGFSLLYGVSSSSGFPGIGVALENTQIHPILVAVSCLLIMFGFGYKIAAVPFHFWAPDVYEGAPTAVSGFLASVSKGAGFIVLLRFITLVLPTLGIRAQYVISAMAVLSMLLGNILAMQQKNIKRLLAYSSIAHAGYLLVGVASGTTDSSAAIFYYLSGYLFTNLAAFALIEIASRKSGSTEISNLAGLSRRNPGLALMFLVVFLSLAGIPPFTGFAGKFFVFYSAAKASLNWLVVVGVLNSVLALFYYLNVIKVIYARPQPEGEVAPKLVYPIGEKIGLAVCILAVLYFGVFYLPWYDVLTRAGMMLWK